MKESPSSRDTTPAVEQAVRAARLDIVFGGQPMALTVSVTLAAITVAIAAQTTPPSLLYTWFGSIILLSVLRGLLYRRYKGVSRADPSISPDPAIWERRFQLGCLGAGIVWGSSALLVFPADITLQVFVAFVLAGVSAGAMIELAVMPRAARAFVMPCVLPLALLFLLQGGAIGIAMGTMACMYVALLAFAARQAQEQLTQTVTAQLEATANRHELASTAANLETSEEQLRIALTRSERMKNEFVSIVSHELRTPLTAIRGSLGLLAYQMGSESEKFRQLLQLAERNAERLAMLIDDLLDLDKMEAGTLQLHLNPQPLLPLLGQAISTNTPFASTRNVTLSAVQPLARGMAAVDGQRFLQVMTNLISNAVKFSPPGSGVDIALLRNGENLRIEVRDCGPGIAPELHTRIFEKFYQADASDSRAKGGTGMGLAISRAIVEQMHGKIGLESRPGSGTTFYFELPLREQ